jgi:hypothetical protein
MLFTDRDLITFEDVLTIDPAVGEVASTESIPTEGDASFVHQAVEECANTLLANMQNVDYLFNYNLTQQGLFPYSDSTPAPRIRIGQVVVDSDTSTYWSPLKRYAAYLALRNFYQICCNRKIGDKYDEKVKKVEKDLKGQYWAAVKAAGLPVCFSPIPCPGAKYELSQGKWSDGNVMQVVGGSTSGADWDVCVTWLKPGSVESAPSETVTITTTANQRLQVNISSLVVPDGVTSWKIFAGVSGSTMYFQASLPVGTTTYTFTADPISTGTPVGRGQSKDASLTFINLFTRG